MGGVDNIGMLFAGGSMNVGNDTTVHNGLSEQVLGDTFWRRWYNTIFFGANYKGRSYTCLLGISAILVSVLIDLDHLYLPMVFNQKRPLHLPFLVAIWTCVYLYSSRRAGRLFKFMLRRKNESFR